VKPHSANSANADNDDITLSRRGAFVLDDNSLQIRMPNSKSDLGNYKTERGDISPILSSIRKTYQNQVLESLSANDSLSDYENK
jgi:hypothetical protein